MCGIAGIFSFSPERQPASSELVTKMTRTLTHRGPDGEGVWLGPAGRIGLGHRRLSIVDLDLAASQPMLNHRGDLALIFNGEIYNHAALRREIEERSPRPWRTDHSDTEVLLHGFDLWGIDVVHRLRGMFAFGLWDARAQQLWLVRDRLGKKPLYFARIGERLAFASEIKALLEVPGFTPEIEPEALGPYLTFLTTPAPLTMFRGVRKLAASEWMRVDADGSVEHRIYWDPQAAIDHAPSDFDAASERVLARLEESVAIRTVSDRPIGVFLSGGVDSGLNLALFRRHHEGVVHAFTVGYAERYDGYSDEFDQAASLSSALGSTQHTYRITAADIASTVPALIHQLDEPLADPTCLPTYFVSRLAREHGVVVCQAGEGSDEIFGGYVAWIRTLRLMRALQRTPRAVASTLAMLLMLSPGLRESLLPDRVARRGRGQPPFWGGSEAFTPRLRNRLLTRQAGSRAIDDTIWPTIEALRSRYQAAGHECEGLGWMTFCEARIRLPDFLLMRVDKSAMAAGVEARAPFLDHQFFEEVLALPQALKLPSGVRSKELLKHAARSVLPGEVLERPKQGFGITPLYSWLLQPHRQEAARLIARFADETGLLDRTVLDQLLLKPTGIQLWALYSLALWHQIYLQRRMQWQPMPGPPPLVTR